MKDIIERDREMERDVPAGVGTERSVPIELLEGKKNKDIDTKLV